MSNKKNTKRALITSLFAVAVCVVMLIGTTFAWFTDTASTSVNKIQAGNLDVALYYKDTNGWVSAEGESLTLGWMQKTSADGTTVMVTEENKPLWEPGCTFTLPELKIVNEGNLALKYKVIISGIDGNEKLNEVIDWTMKVDNADETLGMEHSLAAKTGNDGTVTYDEDIFTVSGTMQTTAGNNYQGLSIDGITITVIATQDTVEYDSNGNDYDKNADGTPQFDTWSDNVAVTEAVAAEGDTVLKDKSDDPSIQAVIPEGSTTASELTLIKTPAENPDSVEIDTVNSAVTIDVKIVDSATKEAISAEGDSYFTIDLDVGSIDVVNFYHKGVALTKVTKKTDLNAAGQYYFDSKNGIVTFTTQNFSTFTAVYKYSGGNGTVSYPYLISTAEDLAYVAQKQKGAKQLKLTNDIAVTSNEVLNKYDTTSLIVNQTYSHTYNLDDYTITAADGVDVDYGLCVVTNMSTNAIINATENGGIDTRSASAFCINVKGNYSNAKLTINGGTYRGDITCVQVEQGKCIINGGFFEAVSSTYGSKYTLNCIDDVAGTKATISVKGGTFVNFDPSNNTADGEGTNYVASGYKVVSQEQTNGDIWYTVVAE